MKAINIYHLTRIHDPHGISLLLEALSGRNDAKEISIHEAATLWSFTDEITGILEDRSSDTMDGWLSILDGFYFSYTIEHIGKEFDLLKFSKDSRYVLNVELKSEKIEEERIRKQLEQNRYYLSHVADTIYSFTYVMETDEIYTLGADDRFEKSTMDVLADIFALDNLSEYLPEGIEKCFRAAEYLISPIAEPDKFIQGKYFLTNQQFDFRKRILSFLQKRETSGGNAPMISISGIAGTGKTLLLLSLAMDLSKQDRVLFIHSGPLRKGHVELDRQLAQIDITSSEDAVDDGLPGRYGYVLIDEADHLERDALDRLLAICRQMDTPMVMAYDPHRLLAEYGERAGNAKLPETAELIEKNSAMSLAFTGNIRINRPVYSFLRSMLHLTEYPVRMDYSCIDVLYANDRKERSLIEHSFIKMGYVLVSTGSQDGSVDDIIAREYDKVIMHLDETYYYDDTMHLRVREKEEEALRLLYEGLSRTRDNLCLLITGNRDLFLRIMSIRSRGRVQRKATE